MWLLERETERLVYFVDSATAPSYAILSHTWGDDEVLYQDMAGEARDYRSKAGYQKIVYTLQQAKRDYLWYAWIDTCCIDKSSSAELSEAINSMFRWYANSAVCYAYLADSDYTNWGKDDSTGTGPPDLRQVPWMKYKWSSRGWTLQELIAPAEVRFFDRNWLPVGDKAVVAKELSRLTGIEPSLLEKSGKQVHRYDYLVAILGDCTVAQRMSWAALRLTTRLEDEAYCLFGLFR